MNMENKSTRHIDYVQCGMTKSEAAQLLRVLNAYKILNAKGEDRVFVDMTISQLSAVIASTHHENLTNQDMPTCDDLIDIVKECARCRDALAFSPDLHAKLKNFAAA